MRPIVFLLLLMLLALRTHMATAQSADRATAQSADLVTAQSADRVTAPPVDAMPAQLSLIPWAGIVRDAGGNLDAATVLKADLAGDARRIEQDVFSTSFSSAAYWFVVRLRNNQPTPLKRLLVFDPSWLDDIQLSLTDAQGHVQSFAGGDTRPFAQRSEPNRLSNFALTLSPGDSTLIVRVRTRDPFFVSMKLMTPAGFVDFAAMESLYFGLVYGGLLSLLLFNFVLYLSAREKTYLAYCGLLVAFIAMHLTYNGHVFRWLLPNSPELDNWAHSILIYVYCAAGLTFALIFLDLKAKLPTAYVWTCRLLMALALSFVVSALAGGYRAHVISSIVWVVIFAVTALTLGILSLQKRNTAAIFYLNGSATGLIGSSITALTVMGILPYTFWTFRAVDFGMLLDAIMLSLALSARVIQVRRLERLRRFFSPAVADQLLTATSEELYRPHHREIVVLFLDLRGYTAFTQKHGADEVMRILGEFHAAMGELIGIYEATLERFAGDGIMIFFNDPVEIPDPAAKAARMALQMQERFDELNTVWAQRGYSLALGIGMAQGVATIGAIGFEGRRDYAAIGNVTNLAARLCSKAGPGQILVSSVVADHIGDAARTRALEDLDLKGFPEPVKCYELLAAQAQQESRAQAWSGMALGSIGG